MRIAEIQQLDAKSQVSLLLAFATNLTIAARDAYSDGTFTVHRPEALRDYNEILHQVTQHASHILAGEPGYPGEALADIIAEHARRSGVEKAVEWAWNFAVQNRR